MDHVEMVVSEWCAGLELQTAGGKGQCATFQELTSLMSMKSYEHEVSYLSARLVIRARTVVGRVVFDRGGALFERDSQPNILGATAATRRTSTATGSNKVPIGRVGACSGPQTQHLRMSCLHEPDPRN